MTAPEGASPARRPDLGQSAVDGGQTLGLPAEVWLPVLQDALQQQGHFRFPLRGNSMRPTLPAQCEIEVFPLSGPLRLGQLIVFVTNNTLVAHRLVRRSGDLLVAQGDHRLGPDRPLQSGQVVGQVTGAYIEGRQVWPQRGEAVWATFWLARSHVLRAARWIRQRVLQ